MSEIYLRRFNTPAASAATGGQLEASELDANFTKVHPALRAILNGAAANFNNNARTKGVLPAPPTVTVGTSSTPGGYTREFIFGATFSPFVSGGGKPTTVSGNTTFPCVTADTTFDGVAWRVSTELYGDGVAFLLDSVTANGYRFLVDGQYVSLAGSVSASGAQRWYILEFPTHEKRVVTVEGLLNLAFSRARTKDNGMLAKPAQGAPGLRIINVGDSNTMMFGENQKGDNFATVMSDHLGILDLWPSGVTDTGFVANLTGTYNSYAERRGDWSANAPDALIFWGSINELTQGTSTAAHKTAVATEITQIRSLLGPHVPVFIFGMNTSNEYLANNSLLTAAQNHETAMAEAVSEAADPLVTFIPCATAGTSLFTGTGTGTGNWNQYVNGVNHANADGNAAAGRWAAQRLVEAAAAMAGVPVPAFAPPAPPTSVVLSTGPADSWTYVKLASDFSTTSTTNQDTSMAFTADASSHYEVEGYFYLQSAATTTGPRPGIKWPTAGVVRNIARAEANSSATAAVLRYWGGVAAGANAANTAVTTANADQWGSMQAFFTTTTSVTGQFVVTLASEVSGSAARMMAGSFIRYRKV